MTDLRSLGKRFSVLMIVPSEDLESKVFETLKQFRGVPCIYISLNKTWKNLTERLKKESLNVDDLFFIDCLSPKTLRFWDSVSLSDIYFKHSDTKVVFTGVPSDLKSISDSVKQFQKKAKGETLIAIDSLSTFLLYNSTDLVIDFVTKMTNHLTLPEKMLTTFS